MWQRPSGPREELPATCKRAMGLWLEMDKDGHFMVCLSTNVKPFLNTSGSTKLTFPVKAKNVSKRRSVYFKGAKPPKTTGLLEVFNLICGLRL